ncbi:MULTISPECIES: hydrogenase expression/formation protein HypE [unclassified Nocardioides]|uniref:hydrogenase expression/formation protein HypE n=1 Tax=unclassified Nocardioides TaxID=2615069 RepID=UPI0009E89FAF|nr:MULTISPECIES: hydrogenase expression/formation protein HypE [unclassified Nocardioides]
MTSERLTPSASEVPDPEDRTRIRVEEFRKRRPRLVDEVITMAHGAGGKSSAALVDHVFVEAFRNPELENLGDGAVLTLPGGERLAFSTDSYVVSPYEFPGGSIADLAINGTVNDLAVSGARPQWISAAFIIEEGFSIEKLKQLAAEMRAAADVAGVQIVTGDTKVVPNGAADGLYITTSGVGVIPAGRELSPHMVRPGDRLIVSGTIADHGMAIMLARGNLDIEADIESDSAAVNGLVEALLAAAPGTRWMRDATRGGLGTVANELAQTAGVGVVLDEGLLPIDPTVLGCCDMLGIDPVYVANEGKFVAIVPAAEAEAAVAALRSQPGGAQAAVIGEILADPPGIVAMRTPFGGTRIVDMLVGDPLPRIC